MNISDDNIRSLKKYETLLEEARTKAERFRLTAKKYIPKMYWALRSESLALLPEDAKKKIEKGCAGIWSERTILDALPDEAKNPEKQKAGRLGQKKANSAAFSAAQSEKQRVVVVDTGGNTRTENLAGSPPIEPYNKPNSDAPGEKNSKLPKPDLLDFKFALKFREVQQYMAPLYPKIGDAGEVWFSGIIDRKSGKVIHAQTGKSKVTSDELTSYQPDGSNSSSSYDDYENLI
jgi:hypothetical protein